MKPLIQYFMTKHTRYLIRGFLTSFVLLLPIWAQASTGSVFDDSQATSSRINLQLYGGNAIEAVVGGDGTAYVATFSPNGIFMSSDAGSTWDSLPEGSDFGIPIGVVASDTSNTTAFTIAGIKLFRTQDSGASWDQLGGSEGDPLGTDYDQTIAYGNGRLFAPVRDGSLDISEDDGDTFTNVTIASNVTSIQSISASSTDDDVMVLARVEDDTKNLFVSQDGGFTWGDGTVVDSNYSAVAMDPQNIDFIILYGNDGADVSTSGPTGTFSEFTDLMGDVIYVGNRIYVGSSYTDDDGAHWNTLTPTDGVSSFGTNAIAVDANNTANVYIDTEIGMAVSNDGGDTWEDTNEGLYGVNVDDIAQSADEETVYLATTSGVAKTTNFTDDEPTWTFPIQVSEGSISSVNSIWTDPNNPDTVVAGTNGDIYYSTDGGDTWTSASFSEAGDTVSDFYYTDGVLYAGYNNDDRSDPDGGVQSSTDNGQTWTDLGGAVAVNTLVVDTDGNIFVGAGLEMNTDEATRGVFKYDGNSWAALSGAVAGKHIVTMIDAAGTLVAAAGSASDTVGAGAYRSTDGGETWTDVVNNGLVTDGWFHALAAEPNNSNAVYLSTARPAGTGYVYKSLDGGENWNLYHTGLVDETFNAMLFDGLVVGSNTGLSSLYGKATVTIKTNKNRIKLNKKLTVTVTVKDKATNEGIRNAKVKLYWKNKKNKSLKYAKKKKLTNKNGKAILKVEIPRAKYLVAKWKPVKKSLKESYGTSTYKSKTKRVRLKK